MSKSFLGSFYLLLAIAFMATASAHGGGGHGGAGHGGGGGRSGSHDGGRGIHGSHGHVGARFGVFIGSPFWRGPWDHAPYYYDRHYYGPPYYGPSRIIIDDTSPLVYIQREPKQVWFYCPTPAGYYPYVATCAQQWVPVDPKSVTQPAK